MKNSIFTKIFFLPIVTGLVVLSSCGEDDKVPAPVAGFTYAVDGKTVTITNSSTDATSYAWTFGDGGTSADEAPTHTYEANGSYVISLTVTNESGTDTEDQAVEIVNIIIDGNLADWADVPALAFEGDGSFVKVKMDNLNNEKLFVYVEGTADASSFLDFWVNLDYQKTVDEEADTTGFFTGVYPQSNLGWDVLFEGFFGSADGRDLNLSVDEGSQGMYVLNMYPNDEDDLFSNNNGWGIWNQLSPTNIVKFSEMTTVGDNIAYEFSIDLQSFPTNLIPAKGDQIQFFIDEWINSPESTDGWWVSFLGHYPAGQSTETATAASYELK